MSTISKKQFKQYIEVFDFTGLFNQLGWSYLDEQTPVKLKEETYLFHSVAEKGGFRILVFKPAKHQDLPDYATRLQLDRKIGKLYREHLIIFCDKGNATQIWQLFVKQLGKPSRLSETRWHKGQEPELLYQKTSNLFFTLDQEENITIADVVDVINENFSKNVDQVTKKFYENFRKEHKKFIEFIKGISVVTDREWYASLMLNRLMFCYFIQKKGFLDKNLNYLKEKLTYCQTKKGKDKFYVSFYKNFLLALFHQGLGSPDQSEELKKEIGKIPYLNGGLFDVHELERLYENIDISDKAFETIFNFFDQYNWHLDTNITASGKDINPDVIGFIFEKYINDRAQMGAYYTKEDITDYISKNCIIPFLFDETERKYAKVLKPEAEIMQILKESGDTYIYDAVKKGVDILLPKEIEIGIDTIKPNLIERRKDWNKPALEEYALPTEIWREVVDRRKRYTEIKEKIEKGEITRINDFITYNLNIRQFTQDIIDSHSDPDFIRHFYEALSNITIIDPTCGSGAFLFAAMNILEPLYESCIQRMENFVEEAPKGKYAKFEEILKYVKAPEHPNLKYFVFKNIILRNLYGVDIMKEAVEIAKLRLFLKLVATVEADYKKPNLGLEPLPDIDFNIRSGNTLIGYATKKEIDDLQGMFVTPKMKEQILEECDLVSRAFQRFKEIQLKGYENKKEFTKAKSELNNRLDKLSGNLNNILYKQHYESVDYEKWLVTHQPFHWFAEFYEIINDKGGFDVVIGNPPYVEYSSVKKIYTITNYKCLKSGNLYAFVIEKCLQFMQVKSRIGMIIQMSAFCTPRMEDFQKVWFKKSAQSYISFFDDRPGKLFDGLEHIRVAICLSEYGIENKMIGTSNYVKFRTEFRPFLFDSICYVQNDNSRKESSLLKVNSLLEHSIIEKVWKTNKRLSHFLTDTVNNNFVYYGYGYGYFGKILNYQSYFRGENVKSSTGDKFIYLNKDYKRDIVVALMNSTLFYWFYVNYSDGHNFTKFVIGSIPFDFPSGVVSNRIMLLTSKLMSDLKSNSNRKTAYYKATGQVEYDEYFPKKSKSIIDEIDTVLAEHYGFTEEELDFIINYDIKYRMGKELDGENEE
jgi:predicted nuclease with TOPRIM domain